jgi:hypothetical protein
MTAIMVRVTGMPRKGKASLQGLVVCGRSAGAWACAIPGPVPTTRFISVGPTSNSTADRVARRSGRSRSMPL